MTTLTENSLQVPAQFTRPPRELSLLPFWFWNDELSEAEILRQIADFDAHGVYGFVIHPRVGLPRDTGWMSEKLLGFMKLAVQEAARRDMLVVLYDEGMYPSGSSSGQVVAENPVFACRGLALQDGDVLAEGANVVAEIVTSKNDKLTVVDRPIKSSIRGLHFIGEGPDEDAPPAADLLNPDAMACFVRLVYDRYYQHLGEWFGSTIIGIFTDEPGLLGKCEERNVWPGTTGILEHVHRILGYDFTPHLSALWHDDEPDAARYRADYKRAVKKRLEETYYARLSEWCRAHGVALMGHPSEPDDIGVEKYFHTPGQDLVWRYVVPNSPTALEGEQSTQAKCSSSAMLHQGRRRNSNECFGAYGHGFTAQEMWWVVNWCFVRGVNMLLPHAFYYSVRGPRFDERPPDVGPNSAWWNGYEEFALYCQRLCWLNTDSTHVCNVAILGEADRLPWQVARVCFQNQRDFNYLEVCDLETAQITEEGIFLQGMHYEMLLLEGDYALNVAQQQALEILERTGRVLRYMPGTEESLIESLDRIAPRDLAVTPPQPDLRYRHVRKEGQDFYLLFNEGEGTVEFELELSAEGERFILEPLTAQVKPLEGRIILSPHQVTIITL